jgi:tRNA dimethylallyltransferase
MGSDQRPLAIALMGPTASGKTAAAIALAQACDGEIVSVDSALVYRGLEIGAAKPDLEERAGVAHHLLDLRDPWETYSAAEFASDAAAAVRAIAARGRLPILAGGTGLYFRALLQGLSQLAQVDPLAAKRIHATDPQRIQRALEVFRLTGKPISHWQALPGIARLPARVLKLVLAPADRAVLHQRIERRFDLMLEQGFLDEVRRLRALPQMARLPAPLDLPAIRAVGYRQAWQFLEGQGSAMEFRDKAIFATRQLAKRQLTWLRGELDARWYDPASDMPGLRNAVSLFLGR